MRRVGLILLAAGASTRLGRPKQLVQYQGRSLLRRAAETACAAPCDVPVVVLGAGADVMRSELAGLPVRVVENPDWEQGMASSLRAGLDALGDDLDGAIVMLCDQPRLTSAVIDALAAAAAGPSVLLAASEYGGSLGVPAYFRRSLFPELLALTGAEGARKVIARHAAGAARVAFPGGAVDVDTPDDVARLRSD